MAPTWPGAAPITEEQIFDPATNVLLNCNLYDYKVTTIKDVLPVTLNMNVVESGLGRGPTGQSASASPPPPVRRGRGRGCLQRHRRLDKRLPHHPGQSASRPGKGIGEKNEKFYSSTAHNNCSSLCRFEGQRLCPRAAAPTCWTS